MKKPSLYLCLPAYSLMFMLSVVPLAAVVALSFLSGDLKRPDAWGFVGLDNYGRFLRDLRAWAALGQTFAFTFFSVLLEGVLALGTALLFRSRIRIVRPLRWSWVLPWATPTVVAGLLGRFVLYDASGPFNGLLSSWGVPGGSASFMASPVGAWFSVIATDVWKSFPFLSILLFAGLCQIPDSVVESASIDGAGRWDTFRYVTLPMLAPVLGVALLLRSLDAFRIFDLVFVMTGGGPGTSTETLSLYNYKVLMTQLDFGYGSVLSLATFVSAVLLSGTALLLLKRWWR